MSEKRFYVETVAVRDKVITDKENFYSYEDLDEIVDCLNEQQSTIQSLKEENERLRQSVEYWQKKYEEGTETFQISENDDLLGGY